MINFAKHIQKIKPDTVFVGGFSEIMHGKKTSTKDLDLVVTALNGLENLGTIEEYKTSYPGSKSGMRARINAEFFVDIFIEKDLPEYEIIEGLKCETLNSLKNHKIMVANRL